ncbi:GlcG/HbpS family heme-binding protein [Sphingomonas sp. 35-24ZXX]|uniref:GlcG/HbpS family heme-binding protein n=1 Tax=Sphingomonas sp. 35-24ZXX TaxID=1545915 RepID=UPI00068C0813|nr:heme-binding protein [Sphingomonas sp. 35-24ZXX]
MTNFKRAAVALGLTMSLLCINAGCAQQADAKIGTAGNEPLTYGAPISLDEATRLVERGIALAKALGRPMAFAIVEPSGDLVAFVRMDGVVYASTQVAIQKARSAARFRLDTAEFETRVMAGRTVLLASEEVLPIGGGVPILADGCVIGAIGVSGGTSAEDASMARTIIGE